MGVTLLRAATARLGFFGEIWILNTGVVKGRSVTLCEPDFVWGEANPRLQQRLTLRFRALGCGGEGMYVMSCGSDY